MDNKILGLRTTIYKVPTAELQKAKKWYAKVFETEPYFDEPYYIGYNIGGYELGLQPEEFESTKTSNVTCFWGVQNIQDKFDFFIKNGASIDEEPMNVGGELMVATVKDPWNNIIGLIYNPDFKLL
jgi:predicted enzyme related to lactoylglutathione lyase